MNRHIKTFLLSLSIVLLLVGCSKQEEQPATVETKAEKLSGSVAVEGAKLRYVIEGTGTPTIVIGSVIYYPRTFSARLREHLKLIFMDTKIFMPTYIATNIKELTMESIINDVEDVRKALGFEKIAVMGHSMFALVALEYAKKYPERTSHVIMIAMSPHFNDTTFKSGSEYWESQASDERKKLWEQNQKELTDEVLSSVTPSEAFIMRYVADGPRRWSNPTYDASWLWEGVEINMDLINHYLGVVFREYDIKPGLDRTSMPVFLAVGWHDYGIPYYLWDEFKPQMPTLSFHLFENSGHHPMLEEQELFDKKLIDWIKSH